MAWFYLLLAGALETAWAFGMKQSAGFTRLFPTAMMLIAMPASLGFLMLAMRSLPLGTAYAVWTGIGALGAFACGTLFLGEPAGALRLVAAGLILAGLALMKFSSA